MGSDYKLCLKNLCRTFCDLDQITLILSVTETVSFSAPRRDWTIFLQSSELMHTLKPQRDFSDNLVACPRLPFSLCHWAFGQIEHPLGHLPKAIMRLAARGQKQVAKREGHYLGGYACSQLWGLKARVLITAEQSIINPALEYKIPLWLGHCEGILKRLETEIISFRMTHCQIKHFPHYPCLSFLLLLLPCLDILTWKVDGNEARMNGILTLTSLKALLVGCLGSVCF